MTSLADPPAQASPAPIRKSAPPIPDRAVPAFLVGVTGLMTLDDEQSELVARRLRLVFRFLRKGGRASDPDDPSRTLGKSLASLTVPRSTIPGATLRTASETYERMFRAWPGLGDVPIVVMTNLAPGVDTIATRIALEKEFVCGGFHVRAPLPFPSEIYREASTFVKEGDADGNAKRQAAFDALIADVGETNVFPVRLQRDLGTLTGRPEETAHSPISSNGAASSVPSWNERYKLWREELIDEAMDSNDPARRHDRYYAAGEYLAVMSHLLIAVWDGKPGERPGTASVAEARSEGPAYDLLTMSEGVRQAPGGPLLHLFASRPGEGNEFAIPEARLLHPFSVIGDDPAGARIVGERQGGFAPPAGTAAERKEIEAANRKALEIQEDRFGVLGRIAENLREFAASRPNPDAKQCERDYWALLTFPEKGHGETRDNDEYVELIRKMPLKDEALGPEEEGAFSRDLRTLSYLRFKATKTSRKLKNRHLGSLALLFVVTFAAATFLHFFAHWHLHPQETSQADQHDRADIVQDRHDASGAEVPPEDPDAQVPPAGKSKNWWKIGFGTLAALLAAGALGYFFICRMRRDAERHYDYRALAEAVRLQFYWNLAGVGKSVSANYMHRQRSELDWIRGAVRSVAFPYEPWKERFILLARSDRIKVFECVRICWVDVQRDYFEKTSHEYHRRLHAWHKLGAALALAGVGLASFCVLEEWGVPSLTYVGTLALLALAFLAWALVMLYRRWDGDLPNSSEHPSHQKLDWRGIVHWCVPAPEHHVAAYRGPVRRGVRAFFGFLARFPLALALIFVVYLLTLAIDASGVAHVLSLPEGHAWRLILGGVGLLAGALAVAWAEKNLYSEFAYQYNTMHSLFREASHRLGCDIEALKGFERSKNDEAYDQKLEEIHEYLYALGKEALDENAEWLLLHRARPLEPVMAG